MEVFSMIRFDLDDQIASSYSLLGVSLTLPEYQEVNYF